MEKLQDDDPGCLRRLFEPGQPELDLTDPEHLLDVREKAEAVERTLPDPGRLRELELVWASEKDSHPLAAHLAVKLARSRALLRVLRQPFHLSVVFAAYREHVRILPRSLHPHGEDFLREKLAQLRWLFAGLPDADWDLTVVDDGCPEGSGEIARKILEEKGEKRARVLFLAEGIADRDPSLQGLGSVDESRKGGSIVFGMSQAARRTHREHRSHRSHRSHQSHVVAYTDADLSTHLGQTGLLIDAILRGGADVAAGSRREPSSVVIKKGGRNLRGKLFIYLWKGLFPELEGVVDTQCGFKAFRAESVREVAHDLLERQFAFDVELLLKSELRRAGSIATVPIAWIDSEAESTTTDLQPYLPMLRKMVAMYRRYLPAREEADRIATFIDDLDEERWQRLVERIPAGIASREPREFTRWRGVSIDELQGLADA